VTACRPADGRGRLRREPTDRPNSTAKERQKNRRVEILVMAPTCRWSAGAIPRPASTSAAPNANGRPPFLCVSLPQTLRWGIMAGPSPFPFDEYTPPSPLITGIAPEGRRIAPTGRGLDRRLCGCAGWATLVEHDYREQGAAAAHFGIYGSGWFAALNGLLAVNVLCAMLIRLPWKLRQAGFVVTHAGIWCLWPVVC